MADTNIEWADKVWNPVTGCTKVSAGCANCYAATFAHRGFTSKKFAKGLWYKRPFSKVKIHSEKLDDPRFWRKPARIFVNSMSDLFHEKVPYELWKAVVGVATDCERHTFLNLTKRPERMLEFSEACAPMPNQWMGTSVENKKSLFRLDILRRVKARIRYVSFEPLLEDLGDVDLTGIHWVIVGGESGSHSRPFNLFWARRILKQCRKQGAAFFMKQCGAKPFEESHDPEEIGMSGTFMGHPIKVTDTFGSLKLNDRKGGDMEEWPEDLRFREWPKG